MPKWRASSSSSPQLGESICPVWWLQPFMVPHHQSLRWLRERENSLLMRLGVEEYAAACWENKHKTNVLHLWLLSDVQAPWPRWSTQIPPVMLFSMFSCGYSISRDVRGGFRVLQTCLRVLWKGNQMDELLSPCFLKCIQPRGKILIYQWERSVCVRHT